jgi:hypothetical protein
MDEPESAKTNGCLTDVKVFTRSLTLPEIRTEYLSGRYWTRTSDP